MKFHLSVVLFLISSTVIAQSNRIDKERLLEFYQTQKYAEAANYLTSIYPKNIGDYTALSQMAYCYMMSGKLVDAEKIYTRMDSVKPKTIPILINLANINSKRGNKQKAISYYQQIIEVDSTNFNAYKNLANMVDSGSLIVKYLKKANQINPTEADVAFDLSFRLSSDKNFQAALSVLEIAAKADTGNYILQKALMPINNELKHYKQVIETGEYLGRNSNLDDKSVKDLGKAYFFTKDYPKAIYTFKMLEKMEMQSEITLYYTTLAYRELKNYSAAANYAKKVLDQAISPNTTLYYNLLAGIYDLDKKAILAITTYKKGLTFSKSSQTYYQMAIIYDTKLSQPKTALNYYSLYASSKDLDESDRQQLDYAKARMIAIKQPGTSQATQK